MDNVQWLEERRKGIGGSDVAAILGLSPFKTAYQVYREKRREVADWQGNDLTDWGKRMEPAIRQWYSDKTGRSVRLPDKIIFHEKYPFMLASLDGFTDDRRIVEIKTARSGKSWGEPGTSEIPDYYAVQVHHYMIVTGFEVADIPVSIAGSSPELYEVPADKELHEMIIEAEAKFWERVIKGEPPEITTYADAVARFGSSKAEGVIIASPNIIEAVENLKRSKEQTKQHEEFEEDLKAEIIIALGDAGDTLIDPEGNELITYKLGNGVKRFDSKAFEKEQPELYHQYLKQGEPIRRFLIK
jgi:putative phage-type endonuclease